MANRTETGAISLCPCNRLPMLPNEFWLDEVLLVSAPTTDDTVDCGVFDSVGRSLSLTKSPMMQ